MDKDVVQIIVNKRFKRIADILRTGEIQLELLDVKTNKTYKAYYNGYNMDKNKIKLCIYR